MHQIQITPEKCLQDGICVQTCPFGLFRDHPDGIPEIVNGAGELCIGCGHCVAIYPGEAISLDGQGPECCDPVDRTRAPSKEQILYHFRSRRSIRVYKEDPVDRPTLESLLDLARWAPSARNGQPVHWIVFQDREAIHNLARLVVDWMRHNNLLPEIVHAFDNGKDMINRHAPCLVVAHASEQAIKPVEDCSIALAHIEAAAPAFGLGGCWAGFFMTAAQQYQPLVDVLELPQGHRVYGALMLGVPRFSYRRIPPRQELQVQWR